MSQIIFDGRLHPSDSPLVPAPNRGLRYGDGLFETIRMIRGEMPLFDRHMARLWKGLSLLGFDCPALFTPSLLKQEIHRLAEKNKVGHQARIRLMLIRGNGGLFDPDNHHPHYVIEATSLPDHYLQLNVNGWDIGLYPDARKSADVFSNSKTNNFLAYVMAASYAKKNRLNDCLVLNQYNRIADSTIANLFLIHKGQLITPSLEEGPVAGVMREYLIDSLSSQGYIIQQAPIEAGLLLEADEVFLTNALYGIRTVKQFENRSYTNRETVKIYNRFIQTIQVN